MLPIKTIRRYTIAGFTLVELMIVVAIIGILIIIAVPQYAKVTAKARQTEVKIQLGALYNAEVSFAAENNSYTGCISQIGYARDGAKLYYTMGFPDLTGLKACAPDGQHTCNFYQWTFTAGQSGVPGTYTDVPTAVCTAAEMAFNANIADGGVNATNQMDLPAAATITFTEGTGPGFVVGGVGRILKGGALDIWTIDQGKQMVNMQSGLMSATPNQ